MKSFNSPSKVTANQTSKIVQRKGQPINTVIDNRPTTSIQRKLQQMANSSPRVVQAKFGKGLPEDMRASIESLSGYSLDDVQVHYNSSKPAEVGALAYARGSDIYIAPGQEKHLAHEAWHVVQQKQGRVRPTIQLTDEIRVNDNVGLEMEADRMGQLAESNSHYTGSATVQSSASDRAMFSRSFTLIQRVITPTKPESTPLTAEGRAIRYREQGRDLEGGKYWHEVIFKNGLLYKKTGEVDGRIAKAKVIDGKVIFVYGMNGQIYIHYEAHGVDRQDGFTHANFLGDTSVKTAGQMFIRNGQITRLDNESGHYKPEGSTLEWMLEKLLIEGVNLTHTILAMRAADGTIKAYEAGEYIAGSRIEEVNELHDDVLEADSDYQKVYDAHLDKDIVEFAYFGWPYSRNRPGEGQAKVKIIVNKCNRGEYVKVRIQFSTVAGTTHREEGKTKKDANTQIKKLVSKHNLEIIASDYVGSLPNTENKKYAEYLVRARNNA